MTDNLDELVEELVKDAGRKSAMTLNLAVVHSLTATLYGMFNFWAGMLNTVLAATTSVSALSKIDGSGTLTAILSVLVAALTAMLTFLSPSDRNKFHSDAATEFEILSGKLDRFRDVVVKNEKDYKNLEMSLDELIERYFQIRKTYPVPAWALDFAIKWLKKSGNKEKFFH
jgi:hypothetical protein